MKFGQFFLLEKFPGRTDTEVYKENLEQVQLADELGFHTAWLAEHRFSAYGTLPDCLVFGAAAAATTKQIRIGTAVIVLPFHHPINLAEQIAMLDVMSGGRFDLGVGRGYQAGEFRAFDMDMDESKARFEECLEIMKGLWTSDNFTYKGKFFNVVDATLEPKPIQKPYPPVHMAVMRTPSSFEYALQHGYSFLMGNPYASDPGVVEAMETYEKVMTDQGHIETINDSWALAKCFVHEDDDRAVEIPKESWAESIRTLIKYGSPKRADGTISKDYAAHRDFGEDFDNLPETDPRDDRSIIVGNPERAKKQIAQLQSIGVPNVICWFNNGGGIPQKEVLKAMELFAKEVMPEFAD